MLVKAASPQKVYQLERQKQYYQEETKLFKGMIKDRETRGPQVYRLDTAQPIGEWFKLFFRIVEYETMPRELWKILKATIPVEREDVGSPCEVWPKKASRRVKRNKKRSRKEF